MTTPTQILNRVQVGDSEAAGELLALVYDNLRAIAGSYFRGQPADHTLEPTALVHEAFLKMISGTQSWESRAHFMAVAATAMRQILQDRARRKRTEKHGANRERLTLSGLSTPMPAQEVDIVALEDALARLSALDPRQCRIVELRFFSGLTVEEVAHVLGLAKTTVEKEWTRTRAWLSRELAGAAS